MTPIGPQNAPAFAPEPRTLSDSRLDYAAQTRAIGYDRTDRQWTITTREGDTVTLNIERESTVIYGDDARLTQGAGSLMNANGRLDFSSARLSRQQWGTQAAGRTVTLSVNGDLSEAELVDVQKAIRGVAKMMRDALMGHPTTGPLNRLTHLDTLSEINYSIEREQIRLVSQTVDGRALVYGADGRLPSNGAPLKPMPEGSMPGPGMEVVIQAADHLGATGIAPVRFAKSLARMFESLRADLQKHRPDRISEARFLEKMLRRQLRNQLHHQHRTANNRPGSSLSRELTFPDQADRR